MSGGGSSSKKKTEAKKAEPVIPGTGPMMTQQPFMPGMDMALAQQLAAGYGGDPASFLAQFQQTYAPMQLLDTRPGAAPVPGTPSTPATDSSMPDRWNRRGPPSVGNSGPSSGNNGLGGYQNFQRRFGGNG